MKKLFFIYCLFFVFAISVVAQTPTQTPSEINKDDGEIVKIKTSLIQIDTVVLDKNGKQVIDLNPEDFEIYENGKKQDITNFSYVKAASNNSTVTASSARSKSADSSAPNIPTPLKPEDVKRTIAVVVDDLGLSFQSMVYVRGALKKFVDEQVQPGDLVAIIRTGGGVGAIQQFTNDKRLLYAAVENLRWNSFGRIGTGSPSGNEQTTAENDTQSDSFIEGTIGSLNFIVGAMHELPGRKAMILFSDGAPLLMTNEEELGLDEDGQIADAVRLLVERANRSSVVINTIDARGLTVNHPNSRVSLGEAKSIMEVVLPNLDFPSTNTQDSMRSIAEQTGGRAFINTNDLKGAVQAVLDDQNGYYLLGYQPDEAVFDPNNRRFNKLEVRVKRPGVKVKYRSGFFGFSDQEFTSGDDQSSTGKMINSLISPFSTGDINLRLNSLFAVDAKNNSFIRAFLHVSTKDLKFTDEPDGDKKAVFEVTAYTFGDNGVTVDTLNQSYTMIIKQDFYRQILDKGFVYRINLPVKKSGAYQMRVALRDEQTGKIGAATQFISVPNLKNGLLSLSGITLQTLTKEQIEQISREQSILREKKIQQEIDTETATALRQFKIGDYLQYAYTIYNAKAGADGKPQMETQLRIFQDGKLFLERKSQPLEINGQADSERINFNGAIILPKEMTQGNYVLQVIVRDKLASEKTQIAAQSIDFEIVE